MGEFLVFVYFGFFTGYERGSILILLMNLFAWLVTLVVVAFLLVLIDRVTSGIYVEQDTVGSTLFVPSHVRTVGKVINTIQDAWVVHLDRTGVSCRVSADLFSVGDEVEITYYGDGAVFGHRYCKTIEKY